jgi:hypothetical protein
MLTQISVVIAVKMGYFFTQPNRSSKVSVSELSSISATINPSFSP